MRTPLGTICLLAVCAVNAFAQTPAAQEEADVHALLHASREALGQHELKEAVEHAQKAVELDPAYSDAWKQLGRVRMLRNPDELALAAFEKAWMLNPSWNDDMAVWRIQTILRLEQYERFHLLIESVPEEGLKELPGDKITRWLDLLLTAGREEVAVTLARRRASVEDDAAVASLLHVLADFCDYETDRIPDSVLTWAASSQEAQRIGAMLYHHAGRRALNWGETDEAVALLDAAIEVDASRHGVVGDKGWAYFRAGQFDNAASVWEKEIDSGISHPARWMAWISKAKFKSGDFEAAQEWTERASELDNTIETAADINVRAEEVKDSASSSWVRAIQMAERNEESAGAIDEQLAQALTAPVESSVRLRLRSYQARRKGFISEAIQFARQSLALDSAQPRLRSELFDLLVAEERYKDAAIQVVRLEERVRNGDRDLLPEYTDVLIKMGLHPEGSKVWRSVRERSPNAVKIALMSAADLQRDCRFEEAATILKGLLKSGDASTRVYAHLADLELAMGHYPKAIEIVEQGLDTAPAPSLYRQMAELAEITFDWSAAKSNALRYLEYDSGYVQMQRLASRSMMTLKEYGEVVELNKALIERNDAYRQGHVDLRDAYTGLGEDQKALNHAQRLYELNPQDPGDRRRLAVSYGEAKNFPRALALIKPLADVDLQQAVPIILFRSISTCDLRGMNYVEQVGDQLRNLADIGYHFITPEELLLHRTSDAKRVVVIIADPDPSAFRTLDSVLQEIGGKAVLAVGGSQFHENVESERWFVAASGPANIKRVVVSEDGVTTGNPMTHRIMLDDGRRETLDEMKDRLDAQLNEAAAQLPSDFPVYVYPFGDDGELSLDCTKREVDALQSAVSKHFKAAIVHNDSGYAIPDYNPFRLPAKTIPAPAFIESTTFEDASNIVEYVEKKNPVIRAKLDAAKLLSRHKQYPRANDAFEKALALGTDPAAIEFNWGMNALHQGDVPSALDHLRKAHNAGFVDQEEVLDALVRAENEKAPRLSLDVSGGNDSDGREFLSLGGAYDVFVSDVVGMGGFYDYLMYDRTGLGDESGHRVGLDTKWFFLPENWITAQLWLSVFDSSGISEHVGGRLNLHTECSLLGGYAEVEAAHSQIQTVDAVRGEILSDEMSLTAYSFVADRIDVLTSGRYIDRSDNNASWYLDGRALYRVANRPDVGVGYHGRLGDSDFVSDLYYAPDELEYHAAILSFRGQIGDVRCIVSTELGTAREAEQGWEAVWGIEAQGEVQINTWLQGIGGLSHHETPLYKLDTFNLGLRGRF